MADLVRYEALKAAIAEALTFDDVKDIYDKAEALRAYARMANDEQLELDAAEIRLQAERRIGKLMATRELNVGGRPKKTGSESDPVSKPITLAQFGINKHLADRARKVAALSDEQFEAAIKRVRNHIKDGKRVSVNGARSVMSSRQEPDDSLDYFPTPPWATRALMECVLPACVTFIGDIYNKTCWEPACGEGHMAEVLREYFAETTQTDIHNYGYGAEFDFLDPRSTFDAEVDWIITNPPFGDKTEAFVLHALELARMGVAMFVRLQWLETIGRYEAIFRDHPPTVIAFFTERVNLCKGRWDPNGSTATAYIWLVWVKGRQPRAPFWIPPGQREALTRPDDAQRFTAHPVIKRSSLPPHDPETGEIIDLPATTGDSGRIEPASVGIPTAMDAGSTSHHPNDELTDDAPPMGVVIPPAPGRGPATALVSAQTSAAKGAGDPSVDPFEIPDCLRRKAV